MNNKVLTLVAAAGLVPAASALALTQLGENVELFLTGAAAIEFQDNIFLDTTDEVDDMVFVFSPGIELTMAGSGAGSAKLTYKHHWKFYDDLGVLDEDFADFAFDAKYDSGLVMSSFKLSVKELATNDANSNGTGFLVERTDTKASGSIKYSFSELTAGKIGIDYEQKDYDTVGYIDYDSIAVPITFFYNIQPKVALTAGARLREVDVDIANIEYTDTYYFVGAVGELFSPKWTADINIGYQEREDDFLNEEQSSASYNARAVYTPNAMSSFFFGIARDYTQSATSGSTYAFASVQAGGNYNISDNFSLNGMIQLGESDYESSLREEDLTVIRFGATYNPNDYLTIRADYTYQDVDGNNTPGASEFENNKFVISAAVRY